MDDRWQVAVATTVAALAAYLFVTTAFTGQINLIHAGVFVAVFALVSVVFDRFIGWAATLDSD